MIDEMMIGSVIVDSRTTG